MTKDIYKNIRWRGEVYPDAKALADVLGLTRSAVYNEISRRGCADRLQPGGNFGGGCPTFADGVVYRSMRAAAKALGVSQSHISARLDRDGSLDKLVRELKRKRGIGRRARLVPNPPAHLLR